MRESRLKNNIRIKYKRDDEMFPSPRMPNGHVHM